MPDINLETVAGKLNRVGYETFFQALRQAKRAGNRHVELAHWLGHILQGERTDIALTADHFKLDRGKLLADVSAVVGGFRTNETEMPAVSNTRSSGGRTSSRPRRCRTRTHSGPPTTAAISRRTWRRGSSSVRSPPSRAGATRRGCAASSAAWPS